MTTTTPGESARGSRRRGALRGLRALPLPGQLAEEPGPVAVGRADAGGGRRSRPESSASAHTAPTSWSTVGEPTLRVTVRFLQVQVRSVERRADEGFEPVGSLDVGDATYVGWDEAREREVTLDVPDGADDQDFAAGRGHRDRGAVRRRCARGPAGPDLAAAPGRSRRPPSSAPSRRTPSHGDRPSGEPHLDPGRPGPDRPAWLRRALVAGPPAAGGGGRALPLPARPARVGQGLAASCENDGVFPVLGGPAGEDRVVLALADHPLRPPRARSRRARPPSSTRSRSTSCSACAR